MQLVAVAVCIGVIGTLVAVIIVIENAERRSLRRTSMVTAAISGQDEPIRRPGPVYVDVANRGVSPVMVGLSVRPGLSSAQGRPRPRISVPARPGRRRYRPTAQETIGVVPAGGAVRLPVRLPAGPRPCRVVAVVGEADRRLRVISVRVPPAPAGERDRFSCVTADALFTWLP